ANSLNVPTLKILEYVGLDRFSDFFIKKLNFKPYQNISNYQLSIAMGSLETSLYDLANYFTIFPNNGIYKKLKLVKDYNHKEKNIFVSSPQYISLVNKILSDRYTSVDQFSIKSNLNLPYKNYAVKTGTSNNFKDSWTIGYTPDFLVGVWLGNTDFSSMDKVSGTIGAGEIWSEIMNLLFASPYNKNSNFDFSYLKEFKDNDDKIYYGLKNDNFLKNKYALLNEKYLIINPHHRAVYLLDEESKIFLKAKKEVHWKINGEYFNYGKDLYFKPLRGGKYTIEAYDDNISEKKEIYIID
ncbi:MAG: penicillin-binding transpeptidase domain-containing protein, partial [Patescibacteria group bacterium]|nr:penicillin-binding transpeptidase domain-containing protein [Patescibacteria group bacterium]